MDERTATPGPFSLLPPDFEDFAVEGEVFEVNALCSTLLVHKSNLQHSLTLKYPFSTHTRLLRHKEIPWS